MKEEEMQTYSTEIMHARVAELRAAGRATRVGRGHASRVLSQRLAARRAR